MSRKHSSYLFVVFKLTRCCHKSSIFHFRRFNPNSVYLNLCACRKIHTCITIHVWIFVHLTISSYSYWCSNTLWDWDLCFLTSTWKILCDRQRECILHHKFNVFFGYQHVKTRKCRWLVQHSVGYTQVKVLWIGLDSQTHFKKDTFVCQLQATQAIS